MLIAVTLQKPSYYVMTYPPKCALAGAGAHFDNHPTTIDAEILFQLFQKFPMTIDALSESDCTYVAGNQ